MKKKTGATRTYDTDRYDLRYHITEDGEFFKSVWEMPVYAGPESYNNSHVDKILEPGNNRSADVMNCGYNPFISIRTHQSQDTAMFRP
jgi:hypothetical protein